MKVFLSIFLVIFAAGIRAEAYERCFRSKDTITCFSPEPSRKGEMVTVKLTNVVSHKSVIFQALVTGHSYTLWDGGRRDCKAWYPFKVYSLSSKDYQPRISGAETSKLCGSHTEWDINSLF